MTLNSGEIIKDIRTEFDMLLEFVSGEEARKATADQIERGLFKLLISLGAKLLTLFFVMRSQACLREVLERSDGQKLSYHRDSRRSYVSIFGKITFYRPYFYRKGVGGQCPLDAELSLGEDSYSDLTREVSEYLGVYNVYHKSCDILERLLGLKLSTRVVEENIAEDAIDVEAYYAQKPPPSPEDEAEILVIQADGKGVPIVRKTSAKPKLRLGKGEKRGRKKEAVVTTVYTIAANPRTPEEVVASLYGQEHPTAPQETTSKHAKPQNKHIWATLDGKDMALFRLTKQVEPRLGDHIQHQVALCDGCEALQNRIEKQFPEFVLILDFIHANEYLWDVANSLLGENHPQRNEWMVQRTLQILCGETEQLIDEFHQLAKEASCTASQREQLTKTANYFERNLPFMDYPTYLANGWPIASGVIEGACRHFVKDRCELSGMRWSRPGVESLLCLRAVAENDDWDAYHSFRKHQRHLRLYGSSLLDQNHLEAQALHCETLDYANSTTPVHQKSLVHQSSLSNCPKDYHDLPLVV